MSDTILELFKQRVNEFGPRAALLHKYDGEWEEQSWKEWWEQSERIAAGLIELGVQPGDPVCILSETRIEWVWIDMAVTMAGGVVVPIYPSSLPEQCALIVEETGARVAFVEDPSQLDKLVRVRDDIGVLEKIIYLDRAAVFAAEDFEGRRQVRLEKVADADQPWLTSLDALNARGRRRVAEDHRYVANRRQAVEPGDLATIIYTSGTSGRSKGVEHTHQNLVAEVEALSRLELLSPQDRQLLFLPLAHIFAKILFLAAIGTGIQTAFAESLPKVIANLREVRPTFFGAVPRIFEKIHAQLLGDSHRLVGSDGALFERAVRRGKDLSRRRRRGQSIGPVAHLEQKVYRRLVFERIQRLFGDNIRFLFCGGAPLQPHLAEFFHAVGVLILEGYGLTETAAVSTVNLPDDFRFGSVGKPLPGVDVTIAEDDEILVRGSMLMRGYHRRVEHTDACFEADTGWFQTGDLGRFDREGFLYITGRKKHLIVTSGGKNIAPEPIEAKLARQPSIEQAVLVGDGRPFVSALLVLAEPAATWAIQQGISFETRGDLADHPAVRERVESEIAQVNQTLPHFETVRQFAILDEPLSVEGGVLTPTGKVRRAALIAEHRAQIDALYQS